MVAAHVQITGDEKLLGQFRKLAAEGDDIVHELVTELTFDVHRRAVRGVQRGPASGRVYKKYRPDRTHQASAPGEYPASDTGRLASSIQFEPPTSKSKPVGVVGTNLAYGALLEFKSPARGGRPWLLRAFNEATENGERLLQRIFKRRTKL
jgi:phage gpG-like protein